MSMKAYYVDMHFFGERAEGVLIALHFIEPLKPFQHPTYHDADIHWQLFFRFW